MRRFLLATLLTINFLCAVAQHSPHSGGFHIGGSTIDLEYRYHYSEKNFLDITAGIFNLDEGFLMQGTYNWNLQNWENWTPDFAIWHIWGGVGAGIGFIDGHKHENSMLLGPTGILGFGFTMKAAPLTFGLDYRPMVAIALGHDSGIIDRGFFNIGITMTYQF